MAVSRVDRVARLVALLPFVVSALLPALTATRALMLAWWWELGLPREEGARSRGVLLLRLATLWWLLHALRPDAGWLIGTLVLLLATASSGGPVRSWRKAIPAVLLAPALLGFLIELSERTPPATLRAVDLWRQAGVAPEGAVADAALPDGVVLAELPFRLPRRLVPTPLEDSPHRGRAWTLLAAMVVLQGIALLVHPQRGARLLVAAVPLALAASLLARQPEGLRLYFQESGPEGRALLLEVHPAGSDLWDPVRGPLLPPTGSWTVRPEWDQGLFRVVSSGPWAVVREGVDWPEPAPVVDAWLERHPLRAPREGGDDLERGGRGLLQLWAAGEQAARDAVEGSGFRWELAESGALYRRPLP